MKTALVTAIAILSTASAHAATDDVVPKRKPGLWEITTVASGTGMTTIKTCVGADDDIATPGNRGVCSKPKARRMGEEVFVDVTCRTTYGKETLSTAYTGDFSSRYHAIMKMSFDPPAGVNNMGVIIDGRYLGPDCGTTR